MEEKEDIIKRIIEQVDQFRLIDIVSSVYYYYRAVGEYTNMISTVELEYIMKFIYQTKTLGNRQPTQDDIMLVIELANAIIIEKEMKSVEEIGQKEDIIFTQARDDFLYVKEDTEYESMVFEYLNLFHPVEHFFKTYYSFSIESFLQFTNFIQIEYVDRMRQIERILKKSNQKVTREILIEYLVNCNCNILNFNEKTLADHKENLVAFRNILKKFSTNKEQCIEKGFENYPIFQGNNTYICSSIVQLLYQSKFIFEKEIRKDKVLANVYADKKGEYLEILTEDVIKKILKDAGVFPNVRYRENKNNRECDLLVIYDQIILIIEIKGRALKEVSKKGKKSYLNQDLNDNLYKAYHQATRMEKYLRKNKNVSLRFGREKKILKIQNTDQFKIFKVGITLENFRKYAIQYMEFNPNIGYDMLFLSINDLKFMDKYFNYQTEFVHYISQRIKTNQYMHEFYLYDELYLFSEYKINYLQSILNHDHQIKIYDESRYQLFDLRFDTKKKEQILRGRVHPLMDETIKQMEREKLPTYALTIMEILDLDYLCQEQIFEQLKMARLKFKETGEIIHTAVTIDEARDAKGMHIVLGVSDKKNRTDCIKGVIILGSVLKRKYPNYEVIGILNDIEDKPEKIVNCLKIMKPKPGFDKAIEKVEELRNWL